MKYTVTYWPGSARAHTGWEKDRAAWPFLKIHEERVEIEASSFADAQSKTGHLSSVSDGCLIEKS